METTLEEGRRNDKDLRDGNLNITDSKNGGMQDTMARDHNKFSLG